MKAKSSVLSFPFVLNEEQNKHVQLIEDKNVLQLLKEVFNASRTEDEQIKHFKIAKNGVLMTDEEKFNVLKSADFSSIDAFKSSLNEHFQSDNYLIYISGWNRLETELMHTMVGYLKDALNLEDDLAEDADYELFIGKYTKTYGGIHRAECSNLQYVLNGSKLFSYWHPENDMGQRIERKIDKYSNRAEEYLVEEPKNIAENEIQLVGNQGSVFYIPHSWWHVGGSPELSISVTIAIYHD